MDLSLKASQSPRCHVDIRRVPLDTSKTQLLSAQGGGWLNPWEEQKNQGERCSDSETGGLRKWYPRKLGWWKPRLGTQNPALIPLVTLPHCLAFFLI